MRLCSGISILLGLLLSAGCDGVVKEAGRTTGPATIRLTLPAEMGSCERPAVEFDHQAHVKALEQEGCGACHYIDAEKRLLPRMKFKEEPADATDWMEAYHGLCITCHDDRLAKKQATGPGDCGDCHRHLPAAVSTRLELRFDYSLHYRHARASGEECSTCHHVYDEEQKKLVYQKGAEDACNTCHLQQAAEGQTSLGDAAHIACINCHIERQGKVGRTGPWLCTGCHAAEGQAKIEKLDEVPRPDRGQPDGVWISGKEATANAVGFNHELHQAQTDSCSACHHQSIGKCDQCHTVLPRPEGGGISLEQAYHMPDSAWSCVGCHKESAGQGQCAGCHQTSAGVPGQAACRICHWGPPPERAKVIPPPSVPFSPVALEGLPAAGPDFPEDVEIGVLAEKYAPSQFPHEKIVAALNQGVKASRLAKRFHQNTKTLCAGCHHHSPPNERPPACRSCHTDTARAGKDLPDLGTAYHRQCIGCHQAIGHKAQGCTDCHQEVSR